MLLQLIIPYELEQHIFQTIQKIELEQINMDKVKKGVVVEKKYLINEQVFILILFINLSLVYILDRINNKLLLFNVINI